MDIINRVSDCYVVCVTCLFVHTPAPMQNESENSCVYVRNAGLCRPITESEKADYIFTLKIFMAHWGTSKDVQEAVQISRSNVLHCIGLIVVVLNPPLLDISHTLFGHCVARRRAWLKALNATVECAYIQL